MGAWKKSIWKVPLYCITAGLVSWYAIVRVLGRFAVVTLPDGTITVDHTRSMIVYGAVFIAALLIGGLVFFRRMTKKEIFLSASIVVAFDLAATLIQWAFGLTTGPGAVVFLYIDQCFEWSGIISQLVFAASDSVWAGAFAETLVPYLFILFGRKQARTHNIAKEARDGRTIE